MTQIEQEKMLGAKLTKPKQIVIEEMAKPIPNSDEVRVRLEKVGICGSDVHLYLGHRLLDKPLVIGHEGIGYIDAKGDRVNGRNINERVAIEPNIICKKCKHCLSGNTSICQNKKVIGLNRNGAFAEYVCIPSDFAWTLPDTITDEDAVLVEPTAVAYHALLKSKAKNNNKIAVIGLGAIGLLITHLALSKGIGVMVYEINPNKLKIAEEMGASITLTEDTPNENLSSRLGQIWDENDVVSIFECAGSATSATLALASAPRGCEVILIGLSEKQASFVPLRVVREGISIIPSIIYNHPDDFKNTIKLIENKFITPGQFISNQYSLDKLPKALELASEGNATKVVINIKKQNYESII